jgi:hypothetical protein
VANGPNEWPALNSALLSAIAATVSISLAGAQLARRDAKPKARSALAIAVKDYRVHDAGENRRGRRGLRRRDELTVLGDGGGRYGGGIAHAGTRYLREDVEAENCRLPRLLRIPQTSWD